ncbi:MAG: adenosine kinase [Candidatus Kapabacteria bacterium]|nr:adenosine kinase [Candidatus Kapabacteria bacterium]
MKRLQLCGLGNGLVDVQFQVSESDFEHFGIKKGTMTLVTAEEQEQYFRQLQGGVPHRSSGGSAANSIIAFAGFGGKASFKTVLGNDNWGNFYAQEFNNLQIELISEVIPNKMTGTCLILITPDAERTQLTCLGINEDFGTEHINEQTVADSEWLYIEGYKFSEPKGAHAIREAISFAKKHNTKIAVTFSDTFVVKVFREQLTEAVSAADLIFCNETEGCSFTNLDNPHAAFQRLCEIVPNVAFTRGAEGSLIRYNNQTVAISTFDTHAIDTTGAGDMYAAGFLYGITHNYSPQFAGHLGSYAASKIVSQFGARFNGDYTEILQFIKEKYA